MDDLCNLAFQYQMALGVRWNVHNESQEWPDVSMEYESWFRRGGTTNKSTHVILAMSKSSRETPVDDPMESLGAMLYQFRHQDASDPRDKIVSNSSSYLLPPLHSSLEVSFVGSQVS
jgi:hypothetical protein